MFRVTESARGDDHRCPCASTGAPFGFSSRMSRAAVRSFNSSSSNLVPVPIARVPLSRGCSGGSCTRLQPPPVLFGDIHVSTAPTSPTYHQHPPFAPGVRIFSLAVALCRQRLKRDSCSRYTPPNAIVSPSLETADLDHKRLAASRGLP